jgi:predicted nucleotidyltransferase
MRQSISETPMVSPEVLEKSAISVDYTRLQRLCELYQVAYLGVFGSVARGTLHDTSDIDLLVRFKEPVSLLRFIEFEYQLAELFSRPIDLVTQNALSPYLKDRVLQDLQVLYESS